MVPVRAVAIMLRANLRKHVVESGPCSAAQSPAFSFPILRATAAKSQQPFRGRSAETRSKSDGQVREQELGRLEPAA